MSKQTAIAILLWAFAAQAAPKKPAGVIIPKHELPPQDAHQSGDCDMSCITIHCSQECMGAESKGERKKCYATCEDYEVLYRQCVLCQG